MLRSLTFPKSLLCTCGTAGSGIAITCAAIESASCSYLSPGLPMTSFGCTTGGAPDTFTRLKSKPQRLSVSSWDKSGGGGGSGVASAVATPDDAVVCVVSSANGRDRINSGCTSLAGGSGVDAALVWGGAISLMGFVFDVLTRSRQYYIQVLFSLPFGRSPLRLSPLSLLKKLLASL